MTHYCSPKKCRIIGMAFCTFFLTTFAAFAQSSDSLERIAEKAESFYPSKLDSSLILADEVLNRIRDNRISSPLEEKMLDLKGWANRRKGESKLAEEYFLESIALSESRSNFEQLGSTYNRLGLLYRGTGRFDEALESYKISFELRTRLENKRGVAGTLNNMGNLYRAMGEVEKAYESFMKSIEMRMEIGDLAYLSSGYINLGNWMAGESRFDEALNFYEKYKKIQAELKDTLALADINRNIGNVYNELGDYEKALEYYLESVVLLDESSVKDDSGDAYNYFNIGLLYSRTGYHEEAIQSTKNALGIYDKLNDTEGIGFSYQNIGKSFDDLNQPDSALNYYQKALAEYRKLGNVSWVAEILQNIGVVYNKQSSPELALTFLSQALEILEHRNEERLLSNTLNNIGSSYYSLSEYGQAINHYKRALDYAVKTSDLRNQRWAALGLAETYGEMKDFEKAFEYQLLYDVYKDSLLNIERAKAVEELITRYETGKKEAEIKVLTAENAQSEALVAQQNAENRLLIIGILFLIAVVMGIVAWVVHSSRKKALITAQKEQLFRQEIDTLMERQQLESVSAMLEGQEKERQRLAIELHDRIGSLLSLVKMYFSSLNEDISEKQPELHSSFSEGNQFLDDTFSEVRTIIKEMRDGISAGEGLRKDIKALLSKITRLGIQIESHIEVPSKLDNLIEMNVLRIIQEALSNSLKYSKAKKIELFLKGKEKLQLTIRDNGTGFDFESLKESQNEREQYGIQNMQNRVKLLGGEFSLEATPGKGVVIDILIPLVEEPELT